MPRPADEPTPSDWEMTPPTQAAPAIAPTPPTLVPELQPAPAPPPAVAASPPALVTEWISLNFWAARNNIAAPRRLSLPPVESYALATANGVLVVQVGSLTASWDRVEIRLGFAPQVIGNQLFLHALDVKKNLEPLALLAPPVSVSNRLVVIDPGHGGSNPGTRHAADGRNEKEFTLDWARRLAPLLEEKGWRVLLTRTNDVDVSLPDRTAFANAEQADLFVSLHFNASGGGSDPAGVETYCLTPTGMPSSVTRGYADDLRQTFPNNAFDADNLQYAVRVQRALLEIEGITDRGVRRARYQTVLRGQNHPAVLVEGGYLSNPREARRIADPQYRQKLAEAVAKALE